MNLPDGLYDRLVTRSLASALAELQGGAAAKVTDVPGEAAVERISEAFAKQLAALLDDIGVDESGSATRQLRLINELLIYLRQHTRRRLPGDAGVAGFFANGRLDHAMYAGGACRDPVRGPLARAVPTATVEGGNASATTPQGTRSRRVTCDQPSEP